MNAVKQKMHFIDPYLINPTNPISVNIVGAGGTGSKVLTFLMEMNHSFVALGHAGIQVRMWDDDIITDANLGRQRFAESEVGLYKSIALINRVNRWTGTNWKAEACRFEKDKLGRTHHKAQATITITCVDNVRSRFAVADILNGLHDTAEDHRDEPKYWIDFGNTRDTGQVILSTVGDIEQPKSRKYGTVARMPFITDELGELLIQSEKVDDTPSCSLAEALKKQDLFINSSLATMGCDLLWNLFRNGMTPYRGFYHNLKDFRTNPIPVG